MTDPVPHTRRHKRIGGTDLSALVGLSSFGKGEGDVYASIVDGLWTPSNRFMRRGNAAEPVLREMYLATGAALEPHPGIVEWDECFAASVDDIACVPEGSFPVDYKSASINSIKKWLKVDKKTGEETWIMPGSYRVQLSLYMAVFNLPRAELFVGFGKDRLPDEPVYAETIRTVTVIGPDGQVEGYFDILRVKLLTLDRDPEFENRILEAGRAFWRQHIAPKSPPLDYLSRFVRPISVTGAVDGSPHHGSSDAPHGKLEGEAMNLTQQDLDILAQLEAATVTESRESLEAYVPGTDGKWVRDRTQDVGPVWVTILPPDAAPQVHPDWKPVDGKEVK